MNINQLRYFVSVGETQSFTQAAARHYLSQTAITQQIRSLEENLGTRLVDRQNRPIRLTPAGNVFFQEAKAILSRIDTAVTRTQEASAGLVGSIRIGYEKGYECSDLSDRLREFHRAYPNILFTCVRADTDELAERLLAGDLDVIFGWDSTNIRQNPEIEHKLIERIPLLVALYRDHPLSGRTSLTRADLRHETILYMSPSENGDSFLDASFMQRYEQAGYQPKILNKSSDSESILMMVAAEEGISVIPAYTVKRLSASDHLVFIPLDGEDEYEEILMIWNKNRENTALRYFLENSLKNTER